MMARRRVALSDRERGSFNATTAFLHGRMEERATVEWALRLDVHEQVKRLAVLDLLDSPAGGNLSEPWQSAWRLIEESWDTEAWHRDSEIDVYAVRNRLRNGDRSGALVAEIVTLVKPILEVKPLSDRALSQRKPLHRPRKVADLMTVSMTSGGLIDLVKLSLIDVKERLFLIELADALDAALVSALNLGRRIGWGREHLLWHFGLLHRVYFVADPPADEHEPDKFHRGVAPLVKLLFAVVDRLAEVDLSEAQVFAKRWRATANPIHVRIWAALARDPRLASPSDVFEFLSNCDDRRFWDLRVYPEIAELRARRFAELNSGDQHIILKRLRKLPPRRLWSRTTDRALVDKGRLYWTVRELRRIEIAGGKLPDDQIVWIEGRLTQFKDLRHKFPLDEGFPGMKKARWVLPSPDDRYDHLKGADRLDALEKALTGGRRGWDDDPTERASDWIRQEGRANAVLADFERAPDAGAAYPQAWNLFGWTHVPSNSVAEDNQVDTAGEATALATRVLALLAHLPQETVRAAIEGISAWMDAWDNLIAGLPESVAVWLRLWSSAVEATNAQQSAQEPSDLNIVARAADDHEPMDLDTLNTPAGKMVGAFLAACPKTVSPGERPFASNVGLRKMRDAVASAPGRSDLIARHRMIEHLPWFLVADPDWASGHLIEPLRANTDEARALWGAVARQTHFTKVLKIIGEQMAERAVDFELDRTTRSSLVFSLVIESLHAFRENRDPAVENTRVQQMLRSLDEEVRAHAAEAVQRFVRDLSTKTEHVPEPPLAETLFREAAQPFLEQVWPQERSLATPGVARAFADLPATCGEAFAEAVDAIERFLVPFDCWSMSDYGLFGEEEGDGEAKLSQINDQQKAEAFLRLLDRTIGTAVGAIVPMDLGNALEQVRQVAPQLAKTQPFRRLGAFARR